MRVAAIIPAAGLGTRMNAGLPKQFLSLGGKPVLYHTLAVFNLCPVIDEIVVVLSKADRKLAEEEIILSSPFKKILTFVNGGKERIESVFNGLKAVDPAADFVVIHDGCRPFVTCQIIENSVEAAKETGGAIAGIPLGDTLKKTEQGFIQNTIDRKGVWQAQTPQTFRFSLLREAYEKASSRQISATDDAGLVEQLGHPVKIFPGSVFNIKITVPDDLILGEMILQYQKRRGQ
ncbi:MAG: 2-C-methyl-D-erythritol 4-phosphate cytidylyltransferase [Nitrospirae bacterium]|nr:2-C-methyl-D-erythritol 4-phosphate cytidylyltransferase [Nitrospirota bacterium]